MAEENSWIIAVLWEVLASDELTKPDKLFLIIRSNAKIAIWITEVVVETV